MLPSSDEWYKAAYYTPSNSTYYDYPNGRNTAPAAVASGTGIGANGNNEAVYGQAFAQGPADVTQAGGLSPYGVMGLGGNAQEWTEGSFDLTNSSGSSPRGFRGGNWYDGSDKLSSVARNTGRVPTYQNSDVGFRVASLSTSAPPAVPEPSMMVIGTLFGLGGLMAKRRMKK